jgi:amino acid transporter
MSENLVKSEIFTRKSSGLVKAMSPGSAFMYNILTMGLIFPWTYLWAPGALPGGQLVWGILLATIIEIPIALTYIWLSTALPRSGGDYVFQSRVFGGGIGFTVVMSGFVIWILQWVALSGWLVAYLGFAPLFLGLGASLKIASLTQLGIWFTTPNAIVIVSILNAALSLILLTSGFKNYVRMQFLMFGAMILAFILMIITLFSVDHASFVNIFNNFVVNSGGKPGFYTTALQAAHKAGINLQPPVSLIATLMIAPIAWTSLQWAPYSTMQNSEIKGAKSFKNQAIVIIGSLLFTGIMLALLAVAFEHAIGTKFLYIAGAGYWDGLTQGTFHGVYLWPNLISMAISGSPIIIILISLGYILNSFQIVNNCYIGMTRVMVAMSFDRILPESFSKISNKRHTPVVAHMVYFLASLPVILLYNYWSKWGALTLGVTFACGYVFTVTSFAGGLMPFRAKAIYKSSPGAKYQFMGLPLMTVLGLLGGVLAGIMEFMFITSTTYGLTSSLAREVIAGIIVLTGLWYIIIKLIRKSKGINIEYAFKEIPPD